MRSYRSFLTFILALFPVVAAFPQFLSAQQQNMGAYRMAVEPRWGFLAPHHDYMAYFLNRNITAFALTFEKQTEGSKRWHAYYNFPVVGWGIYRSTLGNDHVYGNLTALYGFISRFYFCNDARFNLGNRLGVGVSYISKHFDIVSNPFNAAIGSHLNCFVQADLLLRFRLSTRIDLTGTFGFVHASNGNFKGPNKGVNLVNTGLAVSYKFSDIPLTHKGKRYPVGTDSSRNILSVGLLFGSKVISRFDSRNYPVGGLALEYLRKASPKSLWGVEFCLYYDSSMPRLLDEYDVDGFKRPDYFTVTLGVTAGLQFGRLAIFLQPGIYLKNRAMLMGRVSNKLALRYALRKSMVLSVAIKAHWIAQADFIEFGYRHYVKL